MALYSTFTCTFAEAAEFTRRSRVVDSTGQEQAVRGSEDGNRASVAATAGVMAEAERREDSKEKESKAEGKRSSRRSQRAANRGLYVSPGLRFITRKDLYTFLTSAGVRSMVFVFELMYVYKLQSYAKLRT